MTLKQRHILYLVVRYTPSVCTVAIPACVFVYLLFGVLP